MNGFFIRGRRTPVTITSLVLSFDSNGPTTTVPAVAIGAVVIGFGTGLTLLTWAVQDLECARRGHGTGTLFIGNSSPRVIAAIAVSLVVGAGRRAPGGVHGHLT